MSSQESEDIAVSWQQKVFLGSLLPSNDHDHHPDHLTESFYPTHHHEDDAWLFLHDDNASARCAAASASICECDYAAGDQPILILLQWTKILFLKVARMYSVAPICLALLPLLIGLVLGFWIGKRRNHAVEPVTSKKPSTQWFLWAPTEAATCISSLSTYLWSMLLHYPRMAFWISYQQRFGADVLTNKEEQTRSTLRSDVETQQESGVQDPALLPKHIAVIMDGNRRYGRMKYNNATQGHWDGSQMLVNFAKWCIAEQIDYLTVYAFSTENWNRHPSEVASLMALFVTYCEELRVEALERNIQIRVLSTETCRIPIEVKQGLQRMVEETKHCTGGLTMNICLSYGSRGEIVGACRSIAEDVQVGELQPCDITENSFGVRLLTGVCPDPDVIIRTSGEYRISNFLLWQLAYSELFFIDKTWPELEKSDLLEVIRSYAHGRSRRFGK